VGKRRDAHNSGPEFAAYLSGVVVAYPGRPPLGPLDLIVHPGEILALVGPSGAGKSTILRLLAGLEEAQASGAVARTPGGTVSFVFQAATLMPWADALANVALPLELAGLARPEARARAAETLTAVGLGDRLDARPRQLSGGMAMRVALARALVTEPDLLLLDEPFAALDSVTRRRLIEDLHRLWTSRAPRPAIVFVTHDVEEAVYLAGRTLVLDGATGRAAAELASPGSLPRPAGWRADAGYRAAVEALAAALARAMPALPVEAGA
jgi:NitT/TauT family transport system ATP-binding protein